MAGKKLQKRKLDKLKREDALYGAQVAGSAAEKAQYDHFSEMVRASQVDFVKYNDMGNKWLKKHETLNATIDSRNNMYQNRMMLMCVSPLMNGFTSESILASAGMYIGMAAIDKDFQNNVASVIGTGLKMGADYTGNARLQSLADKALKKANGGRVKYTADSAACTRMSMVRDTYYALREKGADTNAIMTQYQESEAVLARLAKADGVDMDAIYKSERILMGKFCEYDPSFSEMFGEVAFEDVKRTPAKLGKVNELQSDGSTKQVEKMIWEGGFTREVVQSDGSVRTEDYNGGFTVRLPDEDMDRYEAMYESDMFVLMDSYERADAQHLDDVINTSRYHIDKVSSELTKTRQPDMPVGINQGYLYDCSDRHFSGTTRMSLEDGFTQGDIDTSYNNAINGALTRFYEINPKVVDEYLASHNLTKEDLDNGIDFNKELFNRETGAPSSRMRTVHCQRDAEMYARFGDIIEQEELIENYYASLGVKEF